MRSRTLGAVCATCAVAVPTSAEAGADAHATSAPGPDIVAGQPLASFEHARKLPLVKRQLRLEGRRRSLGGERLAMRDRDSLGAELSELSPARLRARARELRRDVRRLRRKIARERHGGAPRIAIPAALESIARCESGGDRRAISASGAYRGKYQFDHGTWAAVGGRGDPAAASETEQDRRAALLYKRAGSTPWPVCGNG